MHTLCLSCEKGRYEVLENFVGTKLVKPTTHFSEKARHVFKKMLLETLKLLKNQQRCFLNTSFSSYCIINH